MKDEFLASLLFSVTWSFRNHSNMMIFCSRNLFQWWKQFIFIWKLDFFKWKSYVFQC